MFDRDIVKEIAAASDEQARGIEQVNAAVAEMDRVVQQTAANSEESSSAAEQLSGQANELASMVGRFELSRSSGQTAGIDSLASAAPSPAANDDGRSAIVKAPANGNGRDRRTVAQKLIPLDDEEAFADF